MGCSWNTKQLRCATMSSGARGVAGAIVPPWGLAGPLGARVRVRYVWRGGSITEGGEGVYRVLVWSGAGRGGL